jgi:hypothetical protein
MRNVPKEIKDVLTFIAEDMDVPYDVVEDVYIHQFEYIAEQMRKGEKNMPNTYENILVKKLGSFIANEKHIMKLKYINDAKEGKADQDSP